MAPLSRIHDFLALKRFAFAGVSRQPNDLSRALLREFQTRGYQVVPVHPEVSEIEGQPCFARIGDIQPPVAGVLLMTPPAATETLVRDCAAAGISRVWMFRGAGRGSVSADAIRFCEANGISVIPGECPFMFLSGGSLVHRLHGLIKKITGSYPKAA